MAKITEKEAMIRSIAWAVRKRKGDVVEMLNNAGIKTRIDEDEKSIWNKLFTNLSNNKKVNNGVADLIKSEATKKTTSAYGEDDEIAANAPIGGGASNTSAIDWKSIASKGLDVLSSALKSFSGDSVPPIPPQDVTTKDDTANTGSSNTTMIVIVSAIVVLGGVFIYLKANNKI